MADLNVTNLFDLSYDQINAMKKKDLVNHIENGKISTQLMVVSNANTLLVTRVTELENNKQR